MNGRRSGLVVVALLALGLFVFAGCGDTMTMSDPAAVDDEETLREFLEDDEIFDDLGPYEAGRTAFGAQDGRGEIDPLTFWRVVTERDREREIVFDPETGIAEVTVHRDIWGELHIVDESAVEYVKPFHHEGIRYATFVLDEEWEPPNGGENAEGSESGENGQNGNAERHRFRRGPWTLTELSGFLGESDTLSVSIDWIRAQSPTVDVTITDPLALMAVPDEIMTFEAGEEVTVTVSGPPEDAILFLHRRFWKSPLVPTGGGTFEGTWTVARGGRHTAWVEAMAHGTLFDSEHPDDSLVWGMPYVVGGTDPE